VTEPSRSAARVVAAWLGWWVVMMSFWVALDDSLAFDELLAGAGAAAIAAATAQAACHLAGVRFRLRARWLLPALRLPWQVVADTGAVYLALWRKLSRGEDPHGGFAEVPVDPGEDGPGGIVRRTLIIGGRSFTPNAFVLGIDSERGVMVVHQLVTKDG
jgi:multisubunit Na+/H+ antiporter MnhE subunit